MSSSTPIDVPAGSPPIAASGQAAGAVAASEPAAGGSPIAAPASVTGIAGDARSGPRPGPLLCVRDLALDFVSSEGRSTALAGVSLDVAPGEVVGLVGETGCGKTVTGLSVLGLLPRAARATAGSITFEGRDLLALGEREMRAIRGARIAMVFQNPATAFNPVFSIGTQIGLVLKAHEKLSRSEADDRIRSTLSAVGLPEHDRILRAYPHQLSGGLLQRAMIAMALVCRPALLIADEPTTALDVTIAGQILRLLRRLQEERGFSVLFITHDLGVVRTVSDRVAVLYAGRVVESAPTVELFRAPTHPYTRGLIAAVPRRTTRGSALAAIPGAVPADAAAAPGCAFASRCPIAEDRCLRERPALRPVGDDHLAACLLAEVVQATAGLAATAPTATTPTDAVPTATTPTATAPTATTPTAAVPTGAPAAEETSR